MPCSGVLTYCPALPPWPFQKSLSTLSSAAGDARSCFASNSALCRSTSSCCSLVSLSFPWPGTLALWILGLGGGFSELARGSPPPVRPFASPAFSIVSLEREPPDCAEDASAALGEEVA